MTLLRHLPTALRVPTTLVLLLAIAACGNSESVPSANGSGAAPGNEAAPTVPPDAGTDGPIVTLSEVSANPAQVAAGSRVVLEARFTPRPGWWIYGLAEEYSQATQIVLDPQEGLVIGELRETPPASEKDSAVGLQWVQHEQTTIELPVKITADAEKGPRTLTGHTIYMVCDKERCLPPVETPFEVDITIR